MVGSITEIKNYPVKHTQKTIETFTAWITRGQVAKHYN